MVYKLYIEDRYGKRTILAKHNNIDVIERKRLEYVKENTKSDIPVYIRVIVWSIAITFVVISVFLDIKILMIISMLFTWALCFSEFTGYKRLRIYPDIIWEDPK